MNLYRIDLVSLSLFALIARTGSIRKSAELANLAVGAASKRISDLEAALGTQLLERHSRGVVLTIAGKALQRHAQRILVDVDHMVADLSDYASGIVGAVSLWANTSAITQFLPVSIAAFVAANPGIRTEMEERNSHEIVLAILDGRADIGIFNGLTPALGLQTITYHKDQLALIVPKGHALANRKSVKFVEALDYELITTSMGTAIAEQLVAEADALGKRLRMRIQVRSFDGLCFMVAAGLGIAVLPEGAARVHVRSLGLRIVKISDEWSHRKLVIGARDFGALARPVRLLMDHLLMPEPLASPKSST